MLEQGYPDVGPLAQFLTYAILGGWVVMLFVPQFRYALFVAMCFGGVFVILTHLLLSNRSGVGDVELWVPYGVIAPLATIAVLLAWPVGAFVRRLFRKPART